MDNEHQPREEAGFATLLLISVLVIATCGLIYELVAGTLASYLLGDSVTQFSTIIGVYLFAMGIGSYLSKFFERNLLSWFIRVEILVGVVGGFSSSILFILFERVESFRILLYTLILITGILVGIEIPLLMRILKDRFQFKDLVAKVFTFDYMGALVASIIFPLLFIPYLGIIRTSLLFGILNLLVALIVCIKLEREIYWAKFLKSASVFFLLVLLAGFVYADSILSFAESGMYADKIIYAKSTPYQRILLTRNKDDLRLFLNGNLQFSSTDEYRYHESLVHPALHCLEKKENVLVMGGGDGLAVREILKYPDVKKITLVDLDKEMTEIFSGNELLTSLNGNSLNNSKVTIVNEDAFGWLRKATNKFDLIVLDFPDPSNYSIGKLYSNAFYRQVSNSLNLNGIVVIQSTSPFVAPKSFWCVNETVTSVGMQTLPYHIYVPAFGEWGYVMASNTNDFSVKSAFPSGLRFMDETIFAEMKKFPRDMQEQKTDVNKLNNQVLVSYFEREWGKLNQ